MRAKAAYLFATLKMEAGVFEYIHPAGTRSNIFTPVCFLVSNISLFPKRAKVKTKWAKVFGIGFNP